VAGGTQGNGGDDDLITGINVTPLVDVVLVLLIILMVTASYIVSKAIPMDLPHADTGQSDTQPRTLTVSIDQSGQLFLDASASIAPSYAIAFARTRVTTTMRAR